MKISNKTYHRHLKKSQEKLRSELEVVKTKVLTKRKQFLIRKPVRDFLADNHLLPGTQDWIGGKGLSCVIITELFQKRLNNFGCIKRVEKSFQQLPPDHIKRLSDLAWSECLAKSYQQQSPDYWNIMKKYLKRFFLIRPSQREGTSAKIYDFDPWDYPRSDNYTTEQEQWKAYDKGLKVGDDKLTQREKLALQTLFKEGQSESIYRVLSTVELPWREKLSDMNFRYAALFDPDFKEFWQGCGLNINENLKFFLSPRMKQYHRFNFYEQEFKSPKFSPFDQFDHGDYTQLKAQLVNSAKVPERCFEKIEDIYLYVQLQELVPTLSRILRPLFLVAHFLEKEDQHIYDYFTRLTKFYLSSIELGNPLVKRKVAKEILERQWEDFLFHAVWQDFLFDGQRYLQKPIAQYGGKGRPLNMTNYWLVYPTKNELRKYKAKLSEGINLTTAKLINFLSREERFNITERHPRHYYNLGAETVKRIYRQAQRYFEKHETPRKTKTTINSNRDSKVSDSTLSEVLNWMERRNILQTPDPK